MGFPFLCYNILGGKIGGKIGGIKGEKLINTHYHRYYNLV